MSRIDVGPSSQWWCSARELSLVQSEVVNWGFPGGPVLSVLRAWVDLVLILVEEQKSHKGLLQESVV